MASANWGSKVRTKMLLRILLLTPMAKTSFSLGIFLPRSDLGLCCSWGKFSRMVMRQAYRRTVCEWNPILKLPEGCMSGPLTSTSTHGIGSSWAWQWADQCRDQGDQEGTSTIARSPESLLAVTGLIIYGKMWELIHRLESAGVQADAVKFLLFDF